MIINISRRLNIHFYTDLNCPDCSFSLASSAIDFFGWFFLDVPAGLLIVGAANAVFCLLSTFFNRLMFMFGCFEFFCLVTVAPVGPDLLPVAVLLPPKIENHIQVTEIFKIEMYSHYLTIIGFIFLLAHTDFFKCY